MSINKLDRIFDNYSHKLLIEYYTRGAFPHEVSGLYEKMLIPLLGNEIISREKIKNFLNKNQYVLTVGFKKKFEEPKFFYSFFPLNENCFNMIKNGKNIFSLAGTDIVGEKSDFAYFAGGGGISLRDKAAGIMHCILTMRNFKYVLSNPVSNEGLMLLIKLGFVPIAGDCEEGLNTLYALQI